jgi:hypothetical protein
VAKQYATHGVFSFAVAPGKYLTSVGAPSVRLHGGRCVVGETVVYARQAPHDNVRCTIPPARVQQARESRPGPRYVQRSRMLKEVIALPRAQLLSDSRFWGPVPTSCFIGAVR